MAQWSPLVETGGWFALLGHFLMVAATLVLLYLAVVLALCLAALPLIILFGRNEDDFLALAEASRADHGPRAVLAYLRRIIVARLNSLLRAVWRCWWFLRGRTRADPGVRHVGTRNAGKSSN